jgi:DNA-binding transcriptional LysR family regulator
MANAMAAGWRRRPPRIESSVELHQLNCFLAVMEEGSFNRAATRLHKTQPAISYQVKQLEDELGQPLFYRGSRRITPTQAGQVLAAHAREVVEMLRRSREAVQRLSEGVAGEIRIGTVNSVGIYFLPDVLRAVREKYTRLHPTVLYRNSREIIEALLTNRVDLALVANPGPDRRLRQETIVQERVSLVCGPSHPFFGRETIRPSELKGQQYVSLAAENPTGELVRSFLARLGVDMHPVVSTDNVETVKKMVEVGLGVAFLPDMVTSQDVVCQGQPEGLARVEVGPPLIRSIVLVTWKKPEMTAAVSAFVEELRAHGVRWKGCRG